MLNTSEIAMPKTEPPHKLSDFIVLQRAWPARPAGCRAEPVTGSSPVPVPVFVVVHRPFALAVHRASLVPIPQWAASVLGLVVEAHPAVSWDHSSSAASEDSSIPRDTHTRH